MATSCLASETLAIDFLAHDRIKNKRSVLEDRAMRQRLVPFTCVLVRFHVRPYLAASALGRVGASDGGHAHKSSPRLSHGTQQR